MSFAYTQKWNEKPLEKKIQPGKMKKKERKC